MKNVAHAILFKKIWTSSQVLALLCMILSTPTIAQEDSTLLDNVVISSSALKYTTGISVLKLTPAYTSTLSESLSSQSTVYFKNYGNDQLSTIALRGTTSNHTAVLWNNIEVSSPTLGMTDFSIWPSFMLDQVSLIYGSSSPQFGSSAIGGAVILEASNPKFTKGFNTSVLTKIGSFGRRELGASVGLSNDKWVSITKVYSKHLTNDFPYQVGDTNYTQTNAGVDQWSVGQNLFYQISPKSRMHFEGLYVSNDRETQPFKTSTDQSTLQDQNTNLALSYEYHPEQLSFKSTLGFIHQNQTYQDTISTQSDQLSWRNEIDVDLSPKMDLKVGTVVNRFLIRTDNYAGEIAEYRTDLYASVNYRPFARYHLSVSLREGIYASDFTPFSPSLGQKYDLVKTHKTTLSIKNTFSRSYRIPTFNDRFWNPGGNPNLLPEHGWNTDAGFELGWKKNVFDMHWDATYFHSQVNDMIVWLSGNQGIWSPINVRNVYINGLETNARISIQNPSKEWKLSLATSYSLTQSIIQEGLTPTNDLGKGSQLPYTPVHSAQSSLQVDWKNWSLNVHHSLTGMRYTNISNTARESVDAYQLIDLSASKGFVIKKLHFLVKAALNNVLDSDYENYKNYAQPGRNYSILIHINFNNHHENN